MNILLFTMMKITNNETSCPFFEQMTGTADGLITLSCKSAGHVMTTKKIATENGPRLMNGATGQP